MKKLMKQFVMWVCFICVLLTGCGGGNKNGDNSNSKADGDGQNSSAADAGDSAAAEGQLSLYCMANDAKIDRYIVAFRDVYKNVQVKKTTFEDASQMDDLIKSELNAGKGPDMIIFPSQTGLDVLSMAKNGAFAALDDKMKNDASLNPDDYLPGTFEAGKVDGKVYALPLTFNIPVYMYDSTVDFGFTAAPVVPYEKILDAIKTAMEQLNDNDESAALYSQAIFSQLLKAINPVDFSMDKQSAEVNGTALKSIIETGSLFQNDTDHLQNVLSLHVKTEVDLLKRVSFVNYKMEDVTHRIWFYNNLYREAGVDQLEVSALSSTEDGAVIASVESCGVITKNAGQYAYEFMRTAMDVNPYSSRKASYGMSPNKNNIKNQIEAHKDMTSIYQSISMRGLDDRMAELLNQLYDSITDMKIFNPVILDMCSSSFQPYFDNSKSYEECYKEFEQKLRIYAGE